METFDPRMTPARWPPPHQTRRRQFTLAGLLSYTLAASVYFSMFASLPPLSGIDPRRPRWWPAAVAAVIAWCVLWVLYRLWGLPQARRVHYAGPVMALGLLLVAAMFVILSWLFRFTLRNPSPLEALEVAWAGILFGCGLSTAVSLPAATLMLLYLATRPAGPAVYRRRDNGIKGQTHIPGSSDISLARGPPELSKKEVPPFEVLSK